MESGRLARPCPRLRITVVLVPPRNSQVDHTRFAYPAMAPAQSPPLGHAHNLPSSLCQNPIFSAVAAHCASPAESPLPERDCRPHSAPAISVRFGNTGWKGFCHAKIEPDISTRHQRKSSHTIPRYVPHKFSHTKPAMWAGHRAVSSASPYMQPTLLGRSLTDQLFIVTIHYRTIHCYYSQSLLFIVTIHRHYSSSLLFINDIYNNFFVVTIHRYYSSIIRSPQISTTHPSCCPVHLRPARPIFQSYELW
jgi:hypothetical protein